MKIIYVHVSFTCNIRGKNYNVYENKISTDTILRNVNVYLMIKFLAGGGGPQTEYFPCEFNKIADRFEISNSTAHKL